jgi:hypothetical protein
VLLTDFRRFALCNEISVEVHTQEKVFASALPVEWRLYIQFTEPLQPTSPLRPSIDLVASAE